MGLMKARHLAGIVGAMAVARGEEGPADANNTTAGKYARDPVKMLASFDDAQRPQMTNMLPTVATSTLSAPPPIPKPMVYPKIDVDKITAALYQPPINSVVKVGNGDAPRSVAFRDELPSRTVENQAIAHIVSGGIFGVAQSAWQS